MMQESLAERVRLLRAQRGLSLLAASKQLGIDRHTLRRVELGIQEPQDPTLAKIAEGYGVPVEELLKEPALAGKDEAPEAGPPSGEWAAAAPDKEFDGFVQSANLHDTLTLNRELSEVARSKEPGTNEHRFLLKRLFQVTNHFNHIAGPFTEVKTSRSRRGATQSDQETTEAS